MDQIIVVVKDRQKQHPKIAICPHTKSTSSTIHSTMLDTMIIQLNKYPNNIEWGYRTIRLYFKMAKDEQIVKYWSPPKLKEWKKNLIYLARHLPPKKGIALAA
jgi:hypothetical protein